MLRRSPATVEHQDRHHAVVLTKLPLGASAGSEIEGASSSCTRVLKLGGAVVSVLDRLDREDVRLLPLRCVNTSAVGLRGYVDNTLPSCCYASP